MRNCVHLITYANRLGGGRLEDLRRLFDSSFKGILGGIHILPFFYPINGVDAGFDPIDHITVDPNIGTWSNIATLSCDLEITADLIVNHISSQSNQFQDFLMNGDQSLYSGMFLTLDSIFPDGATEKDLLRIYRPRPSLPFTTITSLNGDKSIVWTTFTSAQIDLNVRHPQAEAYWKTILQKFHEHGIKTIRLDAVGYAIKKPGTSCFMIPETFAFIEQLTQYARSLELEVLVEINAHYRKQIEIARQVDRVYDFALPPLVLHAIYRGTSQYLKQWLEISPRNAVTVLDTHDGIGVIDVGPEIGDDMSADGLLPANEIHELVNTIHERSHGESLKATGSAARNLDLYQVNCTFYDALGGRDNEYLLARALQFFAPGIPQVYYVGMLAGHNDVALLEQTCEGRDINRHIFSEAEVFQQMEQPVVKGLCRLIQFRNTHAAFNGDFQIVDLQDKSSLCLRWSTGSVWAELDANFHTRTFRITFSDGSGHGELDSDMLMKS